MPENEQPQRQDHSLGTLTKTVSALAIVPRANKMTALDRKAYNSMLLIAQKQGSEHEIHAAPLNEVLRGFDSASGSLQVVKARLIGMMTTVVEWQSPSPAEKIDWGASPLLSEARLYKKGGQNWVSWSYPPTIRAELLDPRRWAQLDMAVIARLTTHAGVALYEITARYANNPSGVTSRHPWQWWYSVLSGAPIEKRKVEFRYFYRDHLARAIEDINKYSGLEIALKQFKRGRFVEDLQFTVRPRATPLTYDSGPADFTMVLRANAMGVHIKTAEDLLYRHGEPALSDALDQLEKRAGQLNQRPIEDPAAYLRRILMRKKTALRDAQAPSQLNFTALTGTASMPTSPQIVSQMQSPGRLSEDAAQAYAVARAKEVEAELLAMPEDEHALVFGQFAAHMARQNHPRSIMKRVEAGMWRSPVILHHFVTYYACKVYGEAWNKPQQRQEQIPLV